MGNEELLVPAFGVWQGFFDELEPLEVVESRYRRLIAKATAGDTIRELYRYLGSTDQYFLATKILGRKDMEKEAIYRMVRMTEKDTYGWMDLWARDHYKSSILTFLKNIFRMITDPESVGLILSYNRPVATAFLQQIKVECERNELLKWAWPEIFWADPMAAGRRGLTKWSMSGISVKRKGRPKEATLEAFGLVDSQPTSRHFQYRYYNDVVVEESVGTEAQIEKTTKAWELSENLGSQGETKDLYEGTLYHWNETYIDILRRKAVRPRIFPATRDGLVDGEPWLLTREALAEKKTRMGPYVFSCQMLLNPTLLASKRMERAWIQYYSMGLEWQNFYRFILVDPAKKKSKRSDFTVMIVVGLGFDGNYYVLDWLRDKMGLGERTSNLFRFHEKYHPDMTYYEQVGAQSDVEHMNGEMTTRNYRFPIMEMSQSVSKEDRIDWLVPIMTAQKLYLPIHSWKTNWEGKQVDLTEAFLSEELQAYPLSTHDDMLDCLASICDARVIKKWPEKKEDRSVYSAFNDREDFEDWDPRNIEVADWMRRGR